MANRTAAGWQRASSAGTAIAGTLPHLLPQPGLGWVTGTIAATWNIWAQCIGTNSQKGDRRQAEEKNFVANVFVLSACGLCLSLFPLLTNSQEHLLLEYTEKGGDPFDRRKLMDQ